MIWFILYVVFFYFTHKQVYAGTHFTGSSHGVAIFLQVLSLVNVLIEFIYIIRYAVTESVFHAIMLLIVALAVVNVVNTINSKVVLSKISKDMDINNPFFFGVYNRTLDVSTTKHALLGCVCQLKSCA